MRKGSVSDETQAALRSTIRRQPLDGGRPGFSGAAVGGRIQGGGPPVSHPFDASTKHLIEERLADWVALSDRPADGPTQVIDADLATVTAAADKVLRIDGPQPWLLHLEVQSSRDPTLLRRLPLYSALLDNRHGLPVWTVLVLLRRDADMPTLTGRIERRFGAEEPYATFRYHAVRVWSLAPGPLLTAGLGALPLALLTDEAAAGPEPFVRRVRERIDAELTPPKAAELWTAIAVLMGLRYDDGQIVQLLREVQGMQESTFYQAILAKGRVQGRVEGEVIALRNVLLRQGRHRFGEPDAQALAALNAITDPDRLGQLSERLLDVGGWADLLAES
jgi:predicted transposase YdaD